jgi:hypothetical protein
MSAIWPDGEEEWLLDSPADWVMPGTYPPPPDYRDDPPASNGTKVVISEDDHYARATSMRSGRGGRSLVA